MAAGRPLRGLAETAVFVVRMRIAECRFRWRMLRGEAQTESALRHSQAALAELRRREGLCARYGGSPGPPVPRSGSGIPLVPPPPHQVADSPIGAPAAVPSCGGATPCPEDAEDRLASARTEART